VIAPTVNRLIDVLFKSVHGISPRLRKKFGRATMYRLYVLIPQDKYRTYNRSSGASQTPARTIELCNFSWSCLETNELFCRLLTHCVRLLRRLMAADRAP